LGKPFNCPNCGKTYELDWKSWQTWKLKDNEWIHDENLDDGTWICQGCGYELSLEEAKEIGLPW